MKMGLEMYNVLREITASPGWNLNWNHTYVALKGNQKIVGYYKQHEDPYIEFKKPIRFETARRKFETDKVRENVWNQNTK